MPWGWGTWLSQDEIPQFLRLRSSWRTASIWLAAFHAALGMHAFCERCRQRERSLNTSYSRMSAPRGTPFMLLLYIWWSRETCAKWYMS